MKEKNVGFSNKVDLIELSDAFRRHAEFDNARLAQELVEHSRALLCILSNYMPEHPSLPENKQVVESMEHRLQYIVGLADAMDMDEVVVPIADNGSPLSDLFKEDVLKPVAAISPIKISMPESAYSADLSALGPVDKKVKTVFDDGISGFMNYLPR